MTKRNDPHRPGAIIPANYEPVLDYNCAASQDGWPVPSFAVVCTQWNAALNAETSVECKPGCMRSCACVGKVAHETGKQIFGSPGKCGSCGAWFIYGELWMHTPTGDYVHLGHDCAQKYELMMDRSAAELANNRNRAAVATQIRKAERTEDRTTFLAQHDGLAAAFELGDAASTERSRSIIADIAARFVQFTSISDKQVALVLKLANDIRNPKPAEEQERHAEAPVGKGVTFEGVIVGAKLRESEYGATWKVTVKVTNDDGAVWLAWGTAPRGLLDLIVECTDAQDAAARTAWVESRMAALAVDPSAVIGSYDRPRLGRAAQIRTGLVGLRVSCKATLERPRAQDASEMETDAGRAKVEARNSERHFVFMSRPSMSPATYDIARPPVKEVRKPKAAPSVTPCE